ncbi:MAG TPA: DUF6036 family nucleotidyltransferase [Acidimicrobiales bacterium]
MDFDPLQILGVLRHHRVNFVVVGGLAAVVHGSDMATFDLDVTPERRAQNLERLVGALRELGATIRVEGAPEGIAFEPSAPLLSRLTVLNLTTHHGDLDLVMTPAGLGDYDEMVRRAQEITVDGVTIQVASLADVIASKEASNRVKDRLTLPGLRVLQRKIAEGG